MQKIFFGIGHVFFVHLYHVRNTGLVSLVSRDNKQAGKNGACADHEGVGVTETIASLIPNLSRRGLMTYSSPSL
jgi:hypothetical protein